MAGKPEEAVQQAHDIFNDVALKKDPLKAQEARKIMPGRNGGGQTGRLLKELIRLGDTEAYKKQFFNKKAENGEDNTESDP